ncbi:MAG: TolB-like 6-bladed beta-propeller domain-containing protein [Dysgonamonadaceae bacterium]|nr:TolB-like 6-bladed beta-propeller domain-containing protein [Dysgonamonadaceae bacterium]
MFQNESFHVDGDYLATPYLIMNQDRFLIVNDPHDLQHFTLFDSGTGNYICRFGSIGMGPGELLLGNVLEFNKDKLISYDIPRQWLFQYELDSITNSKYRPELLAKIDISDAILSRIVITNDSNLLGAGLYKSEYQYVYMTGNNDVIDYNVEVFNSKDPIGVSEKYLSNQGILKKHPSNDKFVYSVFKTSNIDFLEIIDNKINLIKSLRLKNPEFVVDDLGDDAHSISYKETETILGYLDIATTGQFVYALYTDAKIMNRKGEYNPASSNQILVFDWSGNPVSRYVLDEDVYYISVDNDKLYAIGTDDEGSFKILEYPFKKD